jgi:hypothetical protein
MIEPVLFPGGFVALAAPQPGGHGERPDPPEHCSNGS